MSHHVQTPGVAKARIVEQIRARELQGMLLCSPEHVYQSNTLGHIRFVRTCIAGSEAVRIKSSASWVGSPENSGMLLDSGVHSFYLLRWLFGGPPLIDPIYGYHAIQVVEAAYQSITTGNLVAVEEQ